MELLIETVTNPCENFQPTFWETLSVDKTVTLYADREAIQHSDLFHCVLEKIMSQSAVVLMDNEQNHPKGFYPGTAKANLIFMFLGLENFFNLSLDLNTQVFWNPRARILIHAENKPDALYLLDVLWKTSWSTNATILMINKDVQFFTWFPFGEKSCGVEELVEVGVEDVFPVKFSRNLHQCPIRVVAAPVPPYVLDATHGVEPEIMLSIVKALNLSYEPVYLPENLSAWLHYDDESGQPTGVMKMLLEHDIDVVMCHFLRTWLGSQVVDMPVAHSLAELFWYAPYPALASRANNVFKAFAPGTWMAFAAALLGAMVIGFVDHPRTGILDILALVLNQPVTKPSSRLFRYFVIVVSWYALHTSTAYQSSLIVFLSEIAREKPYETLKDLAESDLKFLYVHGTKMMYNQSHHHLWDLILKPNRLTYMPYSDITRITESRDHFTVFSKSIVDYSLQADRFYDKYGFPLFRALAEPFSSDYVVFYVSPGHPLLHEMDRIILWLFDAGLTEYWAKLYTGRQRSKTLLLREPFGLVNLEGAFYILTGALVFSFAVFVGELMMFYFSQRKFK